jgi:hypothetical protein
LNDTYSSFTLSLANDGDQVIAYQGALTNPTPIYAVQTNSTIWQTTATDAQTSAIPAGLEDGITAVAVGAGEGDAESHHNVWYQGSTILGTFASSNFK